MLERAAIERGDVVLDVGCGSGLIGLGALNLVGESGRVIFSDVSERLLAETATQVGNDGRASFVPCRAEALAPIESESIDAVTLRSVLIYVADKAAAFAEFTRVLKPGGSLSLFEPINSFSRSCGEDRLLGYELDGRESVRKVQAVFNSLQPPTDPMIDFDERSLIHLAEEAGFFPIAVDLELRVERGLAQRWTSLLDTAMNPCVPTLREAMAQTLTATEREELKGLLRPLVERGQAVRRAAGCFLWASKP